jgi:hypothetical protein
MAAWRRSEVVGDEIYERQGMGPNGTARLMIIPISFSTIHSTVARCHASSTATYTTAMSSSQYTNQIFDRLAVSLNQRARIG